MLGTVEVGVQQILVGAEAFLEGADSSARQVSYQELVGDLNALWVLQSVQQGQQVLVAMTLEEPPPALY